ncbi:MAG: hypothetical protein IV090_26025 [Candidatus Sericytochromatia bacterium]|nr:hypothetical protein [Candidatus Sericytochromatia bacterium]
MIVSGSREGFAPPDYPAQTELAQLIAILDSQGCLLLRQALPLKPLAALHWRALQAYNRADTRFALGQLSEAETTLYRYGHVPPQACYPAGDPFLALAHFLEPLLLLLSAITTDPVLLYQNSLFRRQQPQSVSAPPLPWHQDAAFLGKVSPVWNVWCPLVNCGEQAPGLEILLLNPTEVLTPPGLPEGHVLKAGDAYELYAFPPEWLQLQCPEAQAWFPSLQVGDALIFHERILHRTGLRPSMNLPRLSLELRVSSAAAAQGCDSLLVPLTESPE